MSWWNTIILSSLRGKSCGKEEISLILCAYYNFNICYVPLLKSLLLFFQCFVFDLDRSDYIPRKVPQLANFLCNANRINVQLTSATEALRGWIRLGSRLLGLQAGEKGKCFK